MPTPTLCWKMHYHILEYHTRSSILVSRNRKRSIQILPLSSSKKGIHSNWANTGAFVCISLQRVRVRDVFFLPSTSYFFPPLLPANRWPKASQPKAKKKPEKTVQIGTNKNKLYSCWFVCKLGFFWLLSIFSPITIIT